MTSERPTHIAVLVACLLASVWMLARQHSGAPITGDTSPANQPATTITAPQLRSAIATLEAALPPWESTRSNDERLWIALAQGKARVGQEILDLSRSTPGPSPSTARIVATSLEAGYGLDAEVRETGGVSSIRSLLSTAVDATSTAQPLSWRLDALSMAMLTGATEHRAALGSQTRHALVQLQNAYRPFDRWQGRGRQQSEEVAQLSHAWQEKKGGFDLGHLSYAALRAAAILGEAELSALADSHVRSLLFRSRRTRDLLETWIAEAASAPNPELVGRLLEYQGSLMQAFFAAHLRLRASADSPPAGAIAVALGRSAAQTARLLRAIERETLARVDVRAVAQALRGLRVARVVLPDEPETASAAHSSRPYPATQ